jgi:Protein of unknown function (DUF2500)
MLDDSNWPGGLDTGDIIFFAFFGLIVTVIVGAILIAIVRGTILWAKNNNSPRVTEAAVVVTKRGHRSSGTGDSSPSTSYFVTFELRGGERTEIRMTGQQYGQLAENDRGQLIRQGTRYLGFDRTPRDR